VLSNLARRPADPEWGLAGVPWGLLGGARALGLLLGGPCLPGPAGR